MKKKLYIILGAILFPAIAFCQGSSFKYSDAEFKVGATKPLEVYFDGMKLLTYDPCGIILDSLVQFLDKYPALIIEIQSHTDVRSSDAFNLTLSQKRAEAVKYYLEDKGIKPERIIPKGYGETDLLYSDDFISKLSDEEEKNEYHIKNRRSVIKILKAD